MSELDQIPCVRLRAIEVKGPDAVSFMQSQLTIDVESIAGSQLHPAAWCNPDGRAEAVLLIAVDGDSVWLVMPEALVAPTLKRARMFSIGRKVTLEHDCAAYPATAAPAPARGQGQLNLAFDPGRALLLGESGDSADTGHGGLSDEWLKADIECAMPWILPETARGYLPQMLGLEALGGLSYRKGCFPGQEVIARVHYRGRVTRITKRFRLVADSPPSPGQDFELSGKPAQVLYAIADPDRPGCVIGLAVVSAEAEDNAEIEIGSSTGTLF